MIKKCNGCGAIFQSKESNKEGYVESDNYDKFDLCKRCFRIKNYGDYKVVDKDKNVYQKIFDTIKKENGLILFLCDVLNIDDSLLELNEFNGKVILVITKKDLLPKSVKENKIINYIKNNYNLNIIDIIFISSSKKYNIDTLINKINKCKNGNKVYLVGNTNAGKSTLLNLIANSYTDKKIDITTSSLPATTLDCLEVKINDNLILIDTPGIISENNFVNDLSSEDVKKVSPKKEIKPRVYQLSKMQSLLIGEYARIDYLDNNKNSFILYLSNDIKVEKINLNTNNSLRNLNMTKLTVKGHSDIVINGLCFCKIINKSNVNVYVNDNVKVYQRESLI